MKLSQVVNYRYQVQQHDVKPIKDEASKELLKLLSDLQAQDIGMNSQIDGISNNIKTILDSFDNIDTMLSKYKSRMNSVIHEQEKPLIVRSYEWYQRASVNDTAEYIRNRYITNPIITDDEIRKHLKTRIKHHSDWKMSGLFIRPEKGDLVEPLVSCSPLYIADTDPLLLQDVKERWNEEFQNKIRYYNLTELRENMFGELPKHQLGIVVLLNFFNYLPLEMIERYLTEIKVHLTPGAKIIFTYNNCDYPNGVLNAENSMNTYTPGRIINNLLNKLDYEILNEVNYPSANVYWFEIQIPGKFNSIRGGQELAKIITDSADQI
jgi:hypothetical protein